MSFDLFGQLFGKARRRKIEAAAAQVLTGGNKAVAVDYGVLGTKLAAGATAALLNATLNHTLPATVGGLLTVAAGGLVAAGPSALQTSGIFSAISPNTLSVVEGIGQGIQSILSAPAAARQATIQAAVSDGLRAAVPVIVSQAVEQINKTNMTGFSASELGKPASTPAKDAGVASTVNAEGQAAIQGDGQAVISDGQAAIDVTGGSQ